MSNIQISELDLETNLNELEANSIVGGRSSAQRRRRSRGRKRRDVFQDNFQFQSNVSIAQGNSTMGSDDKQDNFSDVKIIFL